MVQIFDVCIADNLYEDKTSSYITVGSKGCKVKVKLSRYKPWRHIGGEEV
jgi:hypothetical protein